MLPTEDDTSLGNVLGRLIALCEATPRKKETLGPKKSGGYWRSWSENLLLQAFLTDTKRASLSDFLHFLI